MRRETERFKIMADRDRLHIHDNAHGVSLDIRDGNNDCCQWHAFNLSIEQCRDLAHVLSSVIYEADMQRRECFR